MSQYRNHPITQWIRQLKLRLLHWNASNKSSGKAKTDQKKRQIHENAWFTLFSCFRDHVRQNVNILLVASVTMQTVFEEKIFFWLCPPLRFPNIGASQNQKERLSFPKKKAFFLFCGASFLTKKKQEKLTGWHADDADDVTAACTSGSFLGYPQPKRSCVINF